MNYGTVFTTTIQPSAPSMVATLSNQHEIAINIVNTAMVRKCRKLQFWICISDSINNNIVTRYISFCSSNTQKISKISLTNIQVYTVCICSHKLQANVYIILQYSCARDVDFNIWQLSANVWQTVFTFFLLQLIITSGADDLSNNYALA